MPIDNTTILNELKKMAEGPRIISPAPGEVYALGSRWLSVAYSRLDTFLQRKDPYVLYEAYHRGELRRYPGIGREVERCIINIIEELEPQPRLA